MTPEELVHMQKTLQFHHKNAKDPIWIKAFDAYNQDHPKTPKQMWCSPCYLMVLKYFINK